MRFTTHRDVLLDALKAVIPACSSRTTMPILEHVLLQYEGGRLVLTATDLEVYLRSSLLLEGGSDGAITVPGKLLLDLVRKMPDQVIAVSTEDDGVDWSGRLMLDAGEARYELCGLPEAEYPVIPRDDARDTVTLPAHTLLEMIEQTRFAISDDESRMVLTGALLEAVADGDTMTMKMVATDTYRMTVRQSAYVGAPASFAIIIPGRTLALLKKTLGMADNNVDIELQMTASTLRVVTADPQWGTLTLGSRLLEGVYPTYQRILDFTPTTTVTVERDLLLTALERSLQIAKFSEYSKLLLDIFPTHMDLRCETEAGRGHERIGIVIQAPDDAGWPLRIAFNAGYLSEALRAFSPGDITLRLKDATSPCLLLSADLPTYTSVLMPMNVL